MHVFLRYIEHDVIRSSLHLIGGALEDHKREARGSSSRPEHSEGPDIWPAEVANACSVIGWIGGAQ